ncbi:hypothetical protein GobsT_62680 [Gemmata obscuriglobus]|uniref:hypothetical protein n=1 Tax=Gemmata obscuriglobus TaxID=114 RepID=UPI0011CD0515|nr:hypothetical protein [Gemmata obscuriglobus]QEG31446.1 hypothetical protein GobsT_62680 [Gemmata obscuriglobus]VTS10788.1 unnamed protein product [Gemmata obscuriglobus UQM 2246]
MTRILLTFTAALALATASARSASAQIVVYNGNIPSPPGFYVADTPPFYNGLLFSNGVITAFPAPPPAYYSPFGYAAPYSYRSAYPGRYYYSSPAPSTWRPRVTGP